MNNKKKKLVVHRKVGLARITETWRSAYFPHSIEKPVVDAELPNFIFLVRSAEVLKYHTLLFEYFLSPKGGLRSWCKLCLRIMVIILAVAIFVVPAVTLLVSGFSSISAYILQAVHNLVVAVIWLMGGVIAITIFPFVLRRIRQSIRKKEEEEESSEVMEP